MKVGRLGGRLPWKVLNGSLGTRDGIARMLLDQVSAKKVGIKEK